MFLETTIDYSHGTVCPKTLRYFLESLWWKLCLVPQRRRKQDGSIIKLATAGSTYLHQVEDVKRTAAVNDPTNPELANPQLVHCELQTKQERRMETPTRASLLQAAQLVPHSDRRPLTGLQAPLKTAVWIRPVWYLSTAASWVADHHMDI